MSDFNLRLSFGAYFLRTDSYPHVYLNAHSLLVLRSIASLCCHYNDHITRTRVSMRYAARWITRCPISPRGCRRWKKFCRFFGVEKTFAIVIGGSISAHRGTLWRCRSLMWVFSSYRLRAQVVSAIYIAVRYGVHQSDRSNTVSLWCETEGGRRCIVDRWRSPTCRVGTSH